MDPSSIKISDYLYKYATAESTREYDANNGNDLHNFVTMYGEVLDLVKGKIDNLPNLVDISSCPDNFLPYLGNLVGYRYNRQSDAAMQRIEIERAISIYQKKGTEGSIISAILPYDTGVKIYYPQFNMFTYSVSAYDGNDAYQSGFYRSGIFEIQTNYYDMSVIRSLVEQNRPAGKLAYYKFNDLINLDMPYEITMADEKTTIVIHPIVSKVLKGDVYDSSTGSRVLSGGKNIFGFYVVYGFELGTCSMLRGINGFTPSLSHTYPLPATVVTEQPLGIGQKYSDTGDYSKTGKYSGGKYLDYIITPISISDFIKYSYQPPVNVWVMNYRPSTFSNHGEYSGINGLSGVKDAHWEPKVYKVTTDLASDPIIANDNEVLEGTVEIMTVPIDLDKASFSGNKLIRYSGNRNIYDMNTLYYDTSSVTARSIICSPIYSLADIGNIPINSLIDTQGSVDVILSA